MEMGAHVLMFPLPLQAPVNCYLKLAELLCSAGITVTFLNTDHMHRRLLRHTDVQSRFSQYHPNFHFLTLPDGLPEDHKRCGELTEEMIDSIEAVTMPLLMKYLSEHNSSQAKVAPPVTCIIVDGAFSCAIDMAKEVPIQLIYFDTMAPCALWIFMCLPKLMDAGECPFNGKDLDKKITSIRGLEDFFRRRDLPAFFRSNDLEMIQLLANRGKQILRAGALILNTYEDLDAPMLSHMRTLCPNLYTIGPIHALFKQKTTITSTYTNSLLKEDKTCVSWLDKQPIKSVIYVSIGSQASMTEAESIEIWHGLVNSGQRFLWVKRPGSITGKQREFDNEIPFELLEGTRERGFIVEWAPQEEVLAHKAVGGFFNHAGWNSIVESIYEGVPMVCWPSLFDQPPVSRCVSEMWKIGVDMKDICDRATVEKMVKTVMDSWRDEFMENASRLATLAKESVSKGGKSNYDIDRLIADIRLIGH